MKDLEILMKGSFRTSLGFVRWEGIIFVHMYFSRTSSSPLNLSMKILKFLINHLPLAEHKSSVKSTRLFTQNIWESNVINSQDIFIWKEISHFMPSIRKLYFSIFSCVEVPIIFNRSNYLQFIQIIFSTWQLAYQPICLKLTRSKKWRSTWADLLSWRSVQNLGIWTDMELLLMGWLNCKASPKILIYFPISFWGTFAAMDISCYTHSIHHFRCRISINVNMTKHSSKSQLVEDTTQNSKVQKGACTDSNIYEVQNFTF